MNTVKLFRVSLFSPSDPRRTIYDVTFPQEVPFAVVQIKDVVFTDKAVEEAWGVGNHYHSPESNRWELFVALGDSGVPLFRFRYRQAGEKEFQETEMKAGDACLIPPGNSHAFVALLSGATLRGISNLAYNAAHDVPDKLF